ncbi:MAG: SEC-C domain-containing protein, partial [Alphaproteobacteria bacterium]|nr:SEC-C domain-containing protein [Alphaproteobacteria bacterium]
DAKVALGGELFQRIQKSMVLQSLDQHWKEHLYNLDHLRQGINLRAFAQKDPLNEYKTEAFIFFENMLSSMKESIVHDLSLVELNFDEEALQAMMEAQRIQQEMKKGRQDPAGSPEMQENAEQATGQSDNSPVPFKRKFDQEDPNTWTKIGRNTPCPCGSGKKYKQCHGKVAAA